MKNSFNNSVTLSLCLILVLGGLSAAFSQEENPLGQFPTIAEYEEATGREITSFGEAPALAKLVEEGKLPPVEERLPDEPAVVEPVEEIGEYGGTWRRAALSPSDTRIKDRMGYEPLVRWARDGKTIIPNLCTSWDIEEDGKVYTFHLRKGVKWSDGEPFTADDIMFWYEDVLLDEDLTPTFPAWLSPDGVPGKVEKVDDYAVKFIFASPYSLFLEYLSGPDTGVFLFNYPKHYLKQFHPEYTRDEELTALAKEAGFEFWYQLFGDKATPWMNPDLPTLRPWVLRSGPTAARIVAERNPYYWKVDPQGNQLPYIDKVAWDIVQDTQMAVMKAVQGELDMQGRHMSLADYTLLAENAERGKYDVYLWDEGKACVTFYINQNYKDDEAIAELLRNLDFRKALSLAINRDEINQLVYLGMAAPCYAMFPYESLRDSPSIRMLYEYDPTEANRLLDSLGLDKRDKDGYRLLPDGKTLQLTILVGLGYPMEPDVAELAKLYWEKVGIKTDLDVAAQDLWWTRLQANSYQIVPGKVEFCENFIDWSYSSISIVPCRALTHWAPLWGLWYESLGKAGEKPTGDALKLQELFSKLIATYVPAERDNIAEEILEIWAHNLWAIPTAGSYKIPIVVKKNFRNVPKEASLAYPYCSPGYLNPEQFFFKD